MYYEEHSWQWCSHSYEIDTISSPEGVQHKRIIFKSTRVQLTKQWVLEGSYCEELPSQWCSHCLRIWSSWQFLKACSSTDRIFFKSTRGKLTYQWALKGSYHEEPSSQWYSHCLWNWPSSQPLRYVAQTKYSADQSHSAPVMPEKKLLNLLYRTTSFCFCYL